MSTVPSALPALPRIEHVNLDAIKPDPDQVRKEFHVEHLQGLADSIKAKGVVQPIVVRPTGAGTFSLVAGERRLRASKLAGLSSIPCVVRADLTAADIPVLQLVENLQRADLSLAEVSAGVAALCKSRSQDEVAKLLGKSKSWVSKRAAVCDLPPAIGKLVASGKLQDPEIANGVGELLKIDQDEAKRVLEDIEKPNEWDPPVTRDSVRRAVSDAKAQAEFKAKRAAEEAKRAKEPARALTAQESKWEAEREREEARRKARRVKIRAIEKPCSDLIRSSLPKLAGMFGKKVKMDGNEIAPYYRQELYIRPELSNLEHDRGAVPEHTDDVTFNVVLNLSGKDLVKLLSKLGIEAKGAAAVSPEPAKKPAPAAEKSKAKASPKKRK
jgi:ParB/RepB/Spo0J family partition protein